MCVKQIQLSMTIKNSESNVFEEGDANIGLIDLITAEKGCGAALPPLDKCNQALSPCADFSPSAFDSHLTRNHQFSTSASQSCAGS